MSVLVMPFDSDWSGTSITVGNTFMLVYKVQLLVDYNLLLCSVGVETLNAPSMACVGFYDLNGSKVVSWDSMACGILFPSTRLEAPFTLKAGDYYYAFGNNDGGRAYFGPPIGTQRRGTNVTGGIMYRSTNGPSASGRAPASLGPLTRVSIAAFTPVPGALLQG